MAVDADLVDAVAASVADLYREAETAASRAVARALRQSMDNPAAERRASTLRALRRSAQSIVAALEADTGPTVRNALADAYRHGWTSALVDLPSKWFPRAGIAQAAAEALRERSGAGFIEALAVALHRDLGKVTGNILRAVVDVYRDVQAAAAARILTGAQTRREATQAAWQAWVDRGVTGFTDRSGQRWRLSSYAEMAARTVAQRAATQGQVDRLTSLDVDLVYVSDAVQECERCRPWEGKILRTTPGPLAVEVEHPTRDGVMVTVEAAGTLDEARVAGLFHPNCRHSISAYLPGVTRVPKAKPDPEGDKARQRQRALERRIRRYKEREQAALTDEARKAARARVRTAQAALRDHLAQHPDLKRLRYREQIGGGNIPPADRRDDPATPQGPPSQPTLDGGPAPAPPQRTRRRADDEPPVDEARRPAPNQPELEEPPPPPRDLRALTDEELEAALLAEMQRPDFDEATINRYTAEIDRREAEQRAQPAAAEEPADEPGWYGADEEEDTPENRRIDELVAQGWDYRDAYAEAHGLDAEDLEQQDRRSAVEGERRVGETLDQTVRRMYDDWVWIQYSRAEDELGYLTNKRGTHEGVNPIALFSGPRTHANAYASEELKRWWQEPGNERMTFAEFKAQALGRESDKRRAKHIRETRGRGDFGLS